MNGAGTEIVRRGKRVLVPSVRVNGRTIIIRGRWVRIATVHDESWMEGEPVENPDEFVEALRTQKVAADIFAFSRRLPETRRLYPYHAEDDNLAVIPLNTYDEWWHKRVSRKARQDVTRAQRLGITVVEVRWDESLIDAIVDLFARIPTKQGRPFAYYCHDAEAVRREVSPFADRSVFLCAYHEGQLVGYVKVVFMGRVASLLNIICDEAHFERRPVNALIARAVQTCCQRGAQYLIYGKFTYGNKANDSLAEFKRRNGFEKTVLPRYYVPLSRWGRVALALRLHRGLLGWAPGKAIVWLVRLRSAVYLRLRPRFANHTGTTSEATARDLDTAENSGNGGRSVHR